MISTLYKIVLRRLHQRNWDYSTFILHVRDKKVIKYLGYKSGREGPLGIPQYRWEDEYYNADSIHLAQDSGHWSAVEKTVLKRWSPQKARFQRFLDQVEKYAFASPEGLCSKMLITELVLYVRAFLRFPK